MKSKLLGLMLLAGGSLFAAPHISVGVGFGGPGYYPAPADPYQSGYGYYGDEQGYVAPAPSYGYGYGYSAPNYYAPYGGGYYYGGYWRGRDWDRHRDHEWREHERHEWHEHEEHEHGWR